MNTSFLSAAGFASFHGPLRCKPRSAWPRNVRRASVSKDLDTLFGGEEPEAGAIGFSPSQSDDITPVGGHHVGGRKAPGSSVRNPAGRQAAIVTCADRDGGLQV